jgi:chromosome segregation ATPase
LNPLKIPTNQVPDKRRIHNLEADICNLNEVFEGTLVDLTMANETIARLQSAKTVFQNITESETKKQTEKILSLKIQLETEQLQFSNMEKCCFELEEAGKMNQNACQIHIETNKKLHSELEKEKTTNAYFKQDLNKINMDYNKLLDTSTKEYFTLMASKQRKIEELQATIAELKGHITVLNSSIAHSLVRETHTLSHLRNKYLKLKVQKLKHHMNQSVSANEDSPSF